MSRLAIAADFAFYALFSAPASAELIAWDNLIDNPPVPDFGAVARGAVLTPIER